MKKSLQGSHTRISYSILLDTEKYLNRGICLECLSPRTNSVCPELLGSTPNARQSLLNYNTDLDRHLRQQPETGLLNAEFDLRMRL